MNVKLINSNFFIITLVSLTTTALGICRYSLPVQTVWYFTRPQIQWKFYQWEPLLIVGFVKYVCWII